MVFVIICNKGLLQRVDRAGGRIHNPLVTARQRCNMQYEFFGHTSIENRLRVPITKRYYKTS
jgi:hypothetical protein